MRVSIVVNNFNYVEFVGIAVESALRQTHSDVEIIVVDDGSTDGSLSKLLSFDKSIVLIKKPNGGQGSAYNAGFRRASGEIIIFLDSDDWLFPDAASEVAAAWRPGVAKIQFRLTLVDQGGESLGRHVPRSLNGSTPFELVKQFGAYNSPPGSGNAFSADFLHKIFPMDEARWKTAADTVPILLAPLYGEVVSLARPLGAYRLHRRADDRSLLLNNAPRDLWHEYERITWTKRFVEESLTDVGLKPKGSLLLAPWECRILVLCLRFAGKSKMKVAGTTAGLAWYAITSTLRWPLWSFRQKMLQCGWMISILTLPPRMAHHLAQKHKKSAGVAITS